MPRFAPFAGLRYDPTRVELAKVIAPPYDVVGPCERAALAARHSANAILVELPEPEPRRGADRYAAAAARLAAWRSDGVLVRDPEPAFYPYRMTDTDGSVTIGVLGELGIEEASVEEVLPHEETLPKAKSDRLELLAATRVNLSPIWGLSLAPGLTGLLATDGTATAAAIDDDGVRHELWVVDDPAAMAEPSPPSSARPRWWWPTGTTAWPPPPPTWKAQAPAPRAPTACWRSSSNSPRTRCRSVPSTGCCPACRTDSTSSTPSTPGSTWPGRATAPTARRPRSASRRPWPWSPPRGAGC